jgi:hypothetical protein
MCRRFSWQWAWRILLVASAAAVVLLSIAKLTLDLTRAGPSILPGESISINIPGESPSVNTFRIPAPGVPGKASVGITLLGLDTASNTIRARLAVSVDGRLAGHIKLLHDSRELPINASDSGQWMNLPATLELVNCIVPACTTQYSVQIPLGDILPPGTPTSTFRSTIDLPDDANPAMYPQDKYVVNIFPRLILPANLVMPGNSIFRINHGVSTSTNLTKGGGIADKNVVLLTNPGGNMIVISRPWLDQALTCAVSVIPAVLGLLVFCLVLGGHKRVVGSDSGLTAIVGLLAAWLTILPLRTVLVPAELASTPLTRVDDLLIFDAAVVFLFMALAFALITQSPANEAVGTDVDAGAHAGSRAHPKL